MKVNIFGLIKNIKRGKKNEREGMLEMLENIMEQIRDNYKECKTVDDKAEQLDQLVDFLCLNRRA